MRSIRTLIAHCSKLVTNFQIFKSAWLCVAEIGRIRRITAHIDLFRDGHLDNHSTHCVTSGDCDSSFVWRYGRDNSEDSATTPLESLRFLLLREVAFADDN